MLVLFGLVGCIGSRVCLILGRVLRSSSGALGNFF